MHVLAPGKINLTLDVLNRRPDGYHNISSVMQTIRWADGLEIELMGPAGQVRLQVEDNVGIGAIPADETNLVHRAATAILSAAGARTGVKILLEKYLPHQAGLGGGSSDAAATLAAINRLLGDPLAKDELTSIAATLGGDVPFFLTGGTCLVEGIGERVTPLPDYPPHAVVIAKPAAGVSTVAAYAALDDSRAANTSQVEYEPWDGFTLRNDFQNVVEAMYPEVRAAKQALVDAGCREVLLCGSGSAVFGFIEPAGEYEPPETTLMHLKIGRALPSAGLSVATTVTTTRRETLIP